MDKKSKLFVPPEKQIININSNSKKNIDRIRDNYDFNRQSMIWEKHCLTTLPSLFVAIRTQIRTERRQGNYGAIILKWHLLLNRVLNPSIHFVSFAAVSRANDRACLSLCRTHHRSAINWLESFGVQAVWLLYLGRTLHIFEIHLRLYTHSVHIFSLVGHFKNRNIQDGR